MSDNTPDRNSLGMNRNHRHVKRANAVNVDLAGQNRKLQAEIMSLKQQLLKAEKVNTQLLRELKELRGQK